MDYPLTPLILPLTNYRNDNTIKETQCNTVQYSVVQYSTGNTMNIQVQWNYYLVLVSLGLDNDPHCFGYHQLTNITLLKPFLPIQHDSD